jgi:hypothetical protein
MASLLTDLDQLPHVYVDPVKGSTTSFGISRSSHLPPSRFLTQRATPRVPQGTQAVVAQDFWIDRREQPGFGVALSYERIPARSATATCVRWPSFRATWLLAHFGNTGRPDMWSVAFRGNSATRTGSVI